MRPLARAGRKRAWPGTKRPHNISRPHKQSDLVVVSGMGTVNPAGHGALPLWDSLDSCYSHVEKITAFDASSFPTQIAAEVSNFDPGAYLPPKLIRRTGRATQLAVVAAMQAVEDSKLLGPPVDPHRIGLFVGVSSSQLDIAHAAFEAFYEGGLLRVPPFVLQAFFPNATAGIVSSMMKIKGPSITVSTGCSSGSNAIGLAFSSILRSEIDYAVVVGTDSLITPFGLASFCALRNMSTQNDNPRKACRPFDLHRDGFVLGEAASALVLERLSTARQRGTSSHCSVLGYGSTSSADDLISRDSSRDALARAMYIAIDQAAKLPHQVGFVNAHGCGSRILDEIESQAIQEVFGSGGHSPLTFSIKSVIGHSFSGAGPTQLITSALIFKYGHVPPVTNYSMVDPGCAVNVVSGKRQSVNPTSCAIINDFGYGGSNVSLVVQPVPPDMM